MTLDNLTIGVSFYNGHKTIEKLIKSLPRIYPIIIADDLSDEPLKQEWIDNIFKPEDGNDIRVIRLEKKGYFAGACNRIFQECNTDVLILNQDVWFENLHAFSLLESHRKHFGMIGERIVGTHPAFGDLGYIHGVFMWLRRDAIRAVGMFDQNRYPLWGNSALYQWQVARAGFGVLPLIKIPGLHHERKENEKYGSSIAQLLKDEPEKKDLFIRTPPLLSIIVSCYNYGRYLQDCINSLIGGNTSLGTMAGQSLQSFEVIIVDDASTDDSPVYIKKIADITKGIRAFRLEKNVGTARALNFGIDKAVGKYITFLSADDMRESFSLEKLVEACEQNPHSFAYDDVWLFHTHKRIKKWEMEKYDFETLIWKNQIHAGIMFPKQAWQDVGGYPAIMNDGREDWAFNVALGIKGWCGVHVKQFGYLYRREGQNRTETNTTAAHRQRFLEKMQSLFPGIYRGERPMACCGKGANAKSNNGAVSNGLVNNSLVRNLSMGGSLRMATQVGVVGMVKIEYLGKQMSSTWTGDVTGATYTFGVDRPKGWVDKRDAGSLEEKKGFLGKKDKMTGSLLFKIAKDNSSIQEPIQAVEITQEIASPEIVGAMQGQVAGMGESRVPVAPVTNKIDFPDPENMNVEQIKQLVLTREQWTEVYKAELAGRNRKGSIAFLEERLASFD